MSAGVKRLLKNKWLFVTIGALFLSYKLNKMLQPPAVPKLSWDQGWGDDSACTVNDTSVRPFVVQFTKEMIQDLKYRLKNRRKTQESLQETNCEYGFNIANTHEVAEYWLNQYDFTQRQAYLNQFPQFVTKVQGLDIHYLHIKPDSKAGEKLQVVPLLLLHGWTGSVVEFYKAVPMLAKARDKYGFVFELVIPNLPGYGFSEATTKAGLGLPQVAVLMRNLMHKLGHSKFVVQGGDFGSLIGFCMANLFEHEILGYHSNMAYSLMPISILKWILGSVYPSLVVEEKYANRMYPLSRYFKMVLEETGYFHIQSTKPDSIGTAMDDSPIGMAAYIVEKWSTGTDPNLRYQKDCGLKQTLNLEHIIDNVMVYWIQGKMMTSMRLYAETFNTKSGFLELSVIPTTVPTAVIKFRHEVIYQTDSMLRHKFLNLVHSTTLEYGGHFAPMEHPQALADDIWEAANIFIEFHRKQSSSNRK